jgi:perosamine synthetase
VTDPYIPLAAPDLGEEEIAAAVEALRAGWLTGGPRVDEFERAFADYVGADDAVAFSSCTAALTLALWAMKLAPNDEVLVPSYTFAATADAVVRAGARVVPVDCDLDTLNVTSQTLESAWSPRVRAIVPVHFAGLPCDLRPIYELADARGATVIEDAAHALPATYEERRIGGTGAIAAFSFYATKGITTGEGGALALPPATDTGALAARLRRARLHGLTRDSWAAHGPDGGLYYDVVEPGFKANLTDVGAAIGLVQLVRCDDMHRRRASVAEQYRSALSDVEALRLPVEPSDRQSAHHLFVTRLDLERLRGTRGDIVRAIRSRGVGVGVHYKPIHLQPAYRDGRLGRTPPCPNAETLFERVMSLPLHSRLSQHDVERVIDAVRAVCREHAR